MFKELIAFILKFVDFRLFIVTTLGDSNGTTVPEKAIPEHKVEALIASASKDGATPNELSSSLNLLFSEINGVPYQKIDKEQIKSIRENLSYVNSNNIDKNYIELWGKSYEELYNRLSDKYDAYYRNKIDKPATNNEKTFEASRQWFEFAHYANSPHALGDQIKTIKDDLLYSIDSSTKNRLIEAIQYRKDNLGKLSHDENLKAFYEKLSPSDFNLYKEIEKASIINRRIMTNLELGAAEATDPFKAHLAFITMDEGDPNNGAFGIGQLRASTFGEITSKHLSADEKERFYKTGKEMLAKYGENAVTDHNSKLYNDLFKMLDENSSGSFTGGSQSQARMLLKNMVNTSAGHGKDIALRLGAVYEMMTNIEGQLEFADRVRISKIPRAGVMFDQMYEVDEKRLAQMVFEQLVQPKKRYPDMSVDDMKKALNFFAKEPHGLDKSEYSNLTKKEEVARYFYDKIREHPELGQLATTAWYYYGNVKTDANSISSSENRRVNTLAFMNNNPVTAEKLYAMEPKTIYDSRAEYIRNFGREVYDIQKAGNEVVTIGDLISKVNENKVQARDLMKEGSGKRSFIERSDALINALNVYNLNTKIEDLDNQGLAMLIYDSRNASGYLIAGGKEALSLEDSQSIVNNIAQAVRIDIASAYEKGIDLHSPIVLKGDLFKDEISKKLSEMHEERLKNIFDFLEKNGNSFSYAYAKENVYLRDVFAINRLLPLEKANHDENLEILSALLFEGCVFDKASGDLVAKNEAQNLNMVKQIELASQREKQVAEIKELFSNFSKDEKQPINQSRSNSISIDF